MKPYSQQYEDVSAAITKNYVITREKDYLKTKLK